ncbi:MAG: universal stress protein [Bacteroidetes bacterium]|nr:universal stress protein [Bacteroidota bacterium]
MSIFKNILVPVDFSVQSASVIRYALSWATVENGSVQVLYVNELTSLPFGSSSYPFGVVTFPELENEINEWAKEEYAKLLKEFSKADINKLSLKVMNGKAADTITSFASENGMDVIIMATHSHNLVEKFFLGSTMERVIRITQTPVVVLRDPSSAPAFPPKHVLATTDYSKESYYLFEPLLKLCEKVKAPVTLLAVDSLEASYLGEFDAEDKKNIDAGFNEKGVKAEWVKIRSTDAVEGILDYIQTTKPDLVAMTTHGRSGLSKILLGSTTESIIRQIHIPVLVIRSK